MSAHRPVTAPDLPSPAGPYSPATVFERLVFVSGQGARDPRTNQQVGPGVDAQTEQVLRNVEAILQAAGSGLHHVLKCSVFLTDINDFQAMNEVYGRMFGANRPARTTVEVSRLPAPGLKVEIDCIAYIP
jgi:2-iminobutanoate/2-iminopropanoate deaminase